MTEEQSAVAPSCPIGDTAKEDYRALLAMNDYLMARFVELIERGYRQPDFNPLPLPTLSEPFVDGRTNRFLDGRHAETGKPGLLDIKRDFVLAPNGFLRIEPATAPPAGLPVGELGERLTAALLASYAIGVDHLSGFDAQVERYVQHAKAAGTPVEPAIRRATFWGREAGEGSDAITKAIAATYTDGLLTTAQTLVFLTSHRLAGYRNREDEFLNRVAASGAVNAMAAYLPFAVLGPTARSGLIPRRPPVAQDPHGTISIEPGMSDWIRNMQTEWRRAAELKRQYEPGRSTAGMRCVAASNPRTSSEPAQVPSLVPLDRLATLMTNKAISLAATKDFQVPSSCSLKLF